MTKTTEWNDKWNTQVSQKVNTLSRQTCFTSINTDVTLRMALLFIQNEAFLAC